MAKNLRIAAVALIIYIVLFVPYVILGFARMVSEGAFDDFGEDVSFSLPSSLVVLFYIMAAVVITVNILWIRGFVLIGKHLKNRWLVVSSYFLLIAVTTYSVVDCIPGVSPVVLVAGLTSVFFNGIALIFFGVGILPLKDKVGAIATAYGVLLIVQGSCLALLLLAPLCAILEIPTCVIGLFILFKAANEL
jgi:hypothetical protein